MPVLEYPGELPSARASVPGPTRALAPLLCLTSPMSTVDLGVFGLLDGKVDADHFVDAHRGPDLLADLNHHVDVLGKERLHVLATLTERLTHAGEPRTRLLDDAEIHGHVEQRALAADALAVHDVELGLLERR